MTSRLLLLNGSLRGSEGNTARLLQRAAATLPEDWQAEALCLSDYQGTVQALADRLSTADAFLIGSGVYWGSWGSPLQRFLEVISSYELSPCFLGKPAAALISADSVGGLDVAQRLLGAFSLLGCLLPPLSTVVLSRAACAASAADPEGNADVWQLEDLEVVVNNVVLARAFARTAWATWPVRRLARVEGDYPASGPLTPSLENFG
ncbi:MAG TPA: NAD(P)H-dependent oxidoreductase [Polyangiaceae bacterium]|nr:NAD(P)H-dependent oxidoreductase [Polyangiaceae bacterium]HYQ27539.1 NAD(P)H-dependent oxidoreductase [Polyangiaceae bacterium]